MDKNSERYKNLCKNQKFERRAARIWKKAMDKHNLEVDMNWLKSSWEMLSNTTPVNLPVIGRAK